MPNPGLFAEIGIDAQQAEQTLKRVQAMVDATGMSLNKLLKAGKQTGEGLDQGGGKVDRYGKKMGEGEKALRGFYREQRLQDRTMRESVQTLSSLAFAFSFLSQGQNEVGSTGAKVTKSLMTAAIAAQSAEFGFFALGQAGERMNGTMGKVLSTLGRFGGPISLVIGGIAGLATWIGEADAKMQEWRTGGLDSMVKGLTAAAGGRTDLLKSSIGGIDQQKAAIATLQQLKPVGPEPVTFESMMAPRAPAAATPEMTATQGAVAKSLENSNAERDKEIEKLQEAIKQQEVMLEFETKLNAEIIKNGSEYMKLGVQIGELNKAITTQTMTEQKRVGLIDERIALENQQKDLMKGSLELATDVIAKESMRIGISRANGAQLLALYDKALKLKMTDEQRLKLQVDRNALVQKEIDLEIQRAAARKAGLDKTVEAVTKMQGIALEAEIEAIDNETDRALEAEKVRHAQVMNDITEAFLATDGSQAAVDAKQEALDNEASRNRLNNVNIEYSQRASQSQAFNNLLAIEREATVGAIQDENQAALAAEEDRHEKVLNDIGDQFAQSSWSQEALAQGEKSIEAERRRNIALTAAIQRRADEQHRQNFLSSVDAFSAGMQSFWSKFDSSLGKTMGSLMRAVSTAVQIAKIVSASLAPGGAGAGSAETIMNVLGAFFGGMAEGGYTGKGDRMEPAGIVHKGEIVFEKPIVDRFGPQLLGLRTNLQRSYAVGGMVGSAPAMASAGQELVISGRLDIDNGRVFLRREMPKYTAFEKRKYV